MGGKRTKGKQCVAFNAMSQSVACMPSVDPGPDASDDDASVSTAEDVATELQKAPERKTRSVVLAAVHGATTSRFLIQGATDEQLAKVHARSQGMKAVSGYREKNQQKKDKERNGQRQFKTHE